MWLQQGSLRKHMFISHRLRNISAFCYVCVCTMHHASCQPLPACYCRQCEVCSLVHLLAGLLADLLVASSRPDVLDCRPCCATSLPPKTGYPWLPNLVRHCYTKDSKCLVVDLAAPWVYLGSSNGHPLLASSPVDISSWHGPGRHTCMRNYT